MFINNSAFYITTNNVPNFGEDEDANAKRRLKIFETRSMSNPNSKIEPWYRQNSMHCIAWAAKEITKHRALVEKDELWYEDVSNELGEAEKVATWLMVEEPHSLMLKRPKTLSLRTSLDQIRLPKKKRMTRR